MGTEAAQGTARLLHRAYLCHSPTKCDCADREDEESRLQFEQVRFGARDPQRADIPTSEEELGML